MFKRKKRILGMPVKSAEQRNRECDYIRNYKNIMDVANSFTSKGTTEDKIMLLDYLIESMLDDICSSVIVEPLIDSRYGAVQSAFPLDYYDEKGDRCNIISGNKVDVDLSETYIYVRPWSNCKTAKNLKKISKEDFVCDRHHHSYYYRNINLCHVTLGNHSINAGRYLKKGIISSSEVCMELLYPHCDTDGAHWYNTHTGDVLEEVSDFRLAAVYSLARMKNKY